MRGGRTTAKLMRPLGFPNLVKARQVYQLNRLREAKASYPVQLVRECAGDCPCRQRHPVQVDELTSCERAIIAGLPLKRLINEARRTNTRTIYVDATKTPR